LGEKQQCPCGEYVISLPGLGFGILLSMRKKVTARHKKVLHQKDAILLDDFLGKKEGRIFSSILQG
jgi:hypothetical protein